MRASRVTKFICIARTPNSKFRSALQRDEAGACGPGSGWRAGTVSKAARITLGCAANLGW
jgi:hypothetical protein